MSLDRERWLRIERILDELIELEPSEQEARLRALSAEDAPLRTEVVRLLEAQREHGAALDTPLGAWASDALREASASQQSGERADQRLGAWRLLRRIGEGGMGAVYLAERADANYEQRVAVKLLDRRDRSGDLAARFAQERQILAGLEHPNIARLVDGGVAEDATPWFAMEYVDGVEILKWCAEHRLDATARAAIFQSVCAAVAHAHRHLIVHRDLKPSNILIDASGQVKLLDFGIAKLLHEGATDLDMTRTGARPMTPRYAAPEQIRREPISTATDVFALGAVLYELLSGEPPFAKATTTEHELESAILHAEPKALPRSVPRDLARIVAMAMRKEPQARYSSAEAMLEDLQRLAQRLPVRAHAPSLRYRTGRFVARNRVGVGAALIVLLALIGGIATTTWQARRASEEARRAERINAFLLETFNSAGESSWRDREVTARDILLAGGARLRDELLDQPKLRSELLFIVGDLFSKLGDYAQAESVLTLALATSEEGFGRRSEETVAVLNILGDLLKEVGQTDRARPMLEEALAIGRDLWGEEHVTTATSLANLAALERIDGHEEKALEFFERVLAIDRILLPPDDQGLAQDMNNVAVSLNSLGRNAEADSLYQLVVAARSAHFGPDHPEVALTLANRAGALEDLDRGAEAESLYLRAVDIYGRHYPSGHPNTALTLTNLGMFYRNEGRLDEADSVLTQAVQMHASLNAAPTSESARAWNSLAILAYSRGDLELAAERFDKAVQAFEATIGPDNPGTLTVMNNLGVILHRSGRLTEAKERFETILAARLRIFGEEHADVGSSYKALGMLALDSGDVPAAERHLTRSQSILLESAPSERLMLAEISMGLGRCRMAQAKYAEARTLLESALREFEASLAPEHVLLVQTRTALAELDRRDGRG